MYRWDEECGYFAGKGISSRKAVGLPSKHRLWTDAEVLLFPPHVENDLFVEINADGHH